MAEGVRKSNRIKSLARTIYTEDDFDYEIHYDVSSDISNILESRLKQKNSHTRRKSFPQISKKVGKTSRLGHQDIKSGAKNDQRAFGDVIVNTTDGKSPAISLEDGHITCPVCNKMFGSEEVLEEHMNQHQNGDGNLNGCLVCDTCSRICLNQSSYDKHMRLHSCGRRFRCDICEKAFTDSCSLKRHMKSHGNERPFTCDLCFKSFRDNPTLIRHHRTHIDQPRKHQCMECEKSFADKHSLKRHERTHTGLRPFECTVCLKTFSEPGSFKRHLKIHSGVRNFSCPICKRSFLEKQSLIRHQKNVCGFWDADMSDNSLFHNVSQNQDSCISGAEDPEISHANVGEGVSSTFIENSATSLNDLTSASSITQPKSSISGAYINNTKTNDPGEKSDNPSSPNEAPSLHSLILNDPRLYNSISEIVDSIDSYEKMLDLCGETGQGEIDAALTGETGAFLTEKMGAALTGETGDALTRKLGASLTGEIDSTLTRKMGSALTRKMSSALTGEIDDSLTGDIASSLTGEIDASLTGKMGSALTRKMSAALTRKMGAALTGKIDASLTGEPLPLPDNLMCFECGELLVTGENFKGGKKYLQSSLCGSLKCLNCEDDDNAYGEPPVLTAEVPADGLSPLKGTQEEKLCLERDDMSRNVFGTDESLEHLRERLRTQHGVFLFGDVYDGSDEESDVNDHADVTCSNAATSRSHSTDSEIVQNVFDRQSPSGHLNHKESMDVATSDINKINNSHPDILTTTSPNSFSASEGQQGTWTIITPKMDYEVDDQKIPTVFPCHLCTKVFATSSFLSRHLDLHKNSPHKCMVCGKTFTNSQSLKRHMNTHTGEKPYTCPYCCKRFRDPSNFSKHKKLCSISSIPSPVDTTFSTSSVSSPQSLEDLPLAENVGAYMTNLKRKLRCLPHSSTSNKTSVPHDEHPSFNYDDEEDLPVRFAHPSAVSDSPPESGARRLKRSVAPEEYLSHNDEEGVQTETEEASLLVHCTICEKTFENELSLEMHMKYHSGDPKVTCIECGKSFADQFGLKRHTRIHAGVRPHVCEYCGRGYCDNWSLRKHRSRGCMLLEIKVPADFLHPCPQCTRVFSELEYLDEHMNTHKGLLKFECDICQKKFSEAFNLKRHRRLHMAICPGCDREFRDIQSLTDHRANDCPLNIPQSTTTGKDDGFPCSECGRVYSTKAYLERHKKFHSDLRPYVCEICSKRFSEAFRLRRHLKVHNDAKPFNCQSCEKRFTNSASLHRHMTSSSCSLIKEQQLEQEPVDYPCPLCDKIFTKNYLLARHMNVHSQIRPFACDECERTYKDISSLRRHQMIHQGIKSFICTVCSKDFYYSDSLKRHMAGSCGKKSKSRRRRSRGQRRKRKKANNNTNMKNNNTIGKDILSPNSEHPEETTEKITPEPHNPPYVKNLIYRARIPARDVKVGHWSCHKQKQCWRCHLKFETNTSFLRHSRIHCHENPYHCPRCFTRWSRKQYFRVHLATHKSDHKKTGALNSTPAQPPTPKDTLKKPQRSIPSARVA